MSASIGEVLTSRPGLSAISFAQDAGGVGYVARLLRQVLVEASEDPWIMTLEPERHCEVGTRERATFALRLLAGQLGRRADWLIFNHVGLARAQNAIPSFLRLPYGVFVHDVEAWDIHLHPARKRALKNAAVLISNSAFTAKRVTESHPDFPEVMSCPLGLLDGDPATGVLDSGLLARVGIHAALVVGRISSDERYKGHDQLIESWPAVLASVPTAQLLIAGRGDDTPRLRAKATALGVEHAILFCGYVSEATLSALWKRVAVYAMPSAREGFGLVYLEAMRAAVPCIGSTLDAAGEVIVHNESGFVVDRSQPRELVAALVALLSDDSKRAAMGAAGRRRFEAHFTYSHFRARLLPILSQAFCSVEPRRHPGSQRSSRPLSGHNY